VHATAMDKRIWVKGLALECPLKCADADCPLNALRVLPIAQMNAVVNRLEDKQIDNIIEIHRQCCSARLNKPSE